ncbi:fimbrial protein [Enterobacter sp. 22466]|uniref:fimbrial protein n=1 Tax=Enterobacter sp. 22466 TaxID=3453924 RepID=UPI003F8310CE
MCHRGYFIMLFFLLTLPAAFWAAVLGEGRVSMQGSIIDTPCAIAVDSRDQSIDMAVLSVEQIMRDGQGPTRPFSIRLVDCVLADNPTQKNSNIFRVTFDGTTTNDNLFAVNGQGRGVGLQIADEGGNIALPGEQMQPGTLHAGNMTLDYTIRLVANHKTLRAGPYHSTIRFKLDYY